MTNDFGSGPRPRPSIDCIIRRQPTTYTARVNSRPADPDAQVEAMALAMDSHDWSANSLPSPVRSFLNKGSSNPPEEPANNGTGSNEDPEQVPPPDTKPSLFSRLKAKLASLSRKQWLLIIGILLIIAGGITSYILTRPDPAPAVVTTSKPKPKPLPPPPPTSPLTGLEVSAEDAKHIVTGVMIENSTNARPQTGLQQAGVVYEAIAEYGITRFLALFQESKPGNLGPIRSVRPYYVDWAKSYDAPIAHVGGSPDALNKIKAEKVKDLDQFFNAGAYRRISSRFAPHNVYSTMGQLNDVAKSKGWTTSEFTAWPRKKDAVAKTATATKVDIAISGPTYNVHYDYDAATNSYKRVMGGEAHIDGDSKVQIAPKVVIGLATPYGLEPDGYHSKYQVTGDGQAFIFQDGLVTPVTWKRPQANSMYQFYDANNKPVKLNAGQTWITVVGAPNAVTYAP